MENYEEKYKQALKRAKTILELTDNPEEANGYVFTIFPELRESEDEKWRNWLISHLKGYINKTDNKYAKVCKKVIAWLEKQGEHAEWNERYIADVFEKFGLAKIVREQGNDELMNAVQAVMIELAKQGEQKPIELDTEIRDLWVYIREWNDKFGRLPKDEDELAVCIDYVMKRKKSAWSEEDEKKRQLLIKVLEVNHPNAYFKVNPINTTNMEAMSSKELVDWLKSLKPRWKPTEEQMEALEYFISFHKPQANAAVEGWEEFKNLESLYNNLKSL